MAHRDFGGHMYGEDDWLEAAYEDTNGNVSADVLDPDDEFYDWDDDE